MEDIDLDRSLKAGPLGESFKGCDTPDARVVSACYSGMRCMSKIGGSSTVEQIDFDNDFE
jgi:hypothetical protein